MLTHRTLTDFLADDRGSESVEFGLVAVAMAGISLHLRLRVREALDGQVERAVTEIESAE